MKFQEFCPFYFPEHPDDAIPCQADTAKEQSENGDLKKEFTRIKSQIVGLQYHSGTVSIIWYELCHLNGRPELSTFSTSEIKCDFCSTPEQS